MNFKTLRKYSIAFIISIVPLLGLADAPSDNQDSPVKIWDLTAAYHSVKRDFNFTKKTMELSPDQLKDKTLKALDFVVLMRSYLVGAKDDQTASEAVTVRNMGEEIYTLLTETMLDTLTRGNSLEDRLASERVKAYFLAFETKIAERIALFATETEFQKVRMDQTFPKVSQLMDIARRDPVLLTYLSLMYAAFDYWRRNFKEIRNAQSTGLIMKGFAAVGFIAGGVAASNGLGAEAFAFIGASSWLWYKYNNQEWKQFEKLMNTLHDESARLYRPLNFTRGARHMFGRNYNCYELLSQME
jgi:hypothetical protein